jgi:hypothetical protein
MRDGGKGDKQRPLHVTEEQFNANWDMIFGGDKFKVKEFKEEVKAAIKEIEAKKFFDKAREVAKQIDNDEYHTPED